MDKHDFSTPNEDCWHSTYGNICKWHQAHCAEHVSANTRPHQLCWGTSQFIDCSLLIVFGQVFIMMIVMMSSKLPSNMPNYNIKHFYSAGSPGFRFWIIIGVYALEKMLLMWQSHSIIFQSTVLKPGHNSPIYYQHVCSCWELTDLQN